MIGEQGISRLGYIRVMTQGLRLWVILCTLVEVPTFSRYSLHSSSGGEVGCNGCWYLCTNLHSNLKHVLSIDLGWCNSGKCETMFGTGTSTGYFAVYQLIPHVIIAVWLRGLRKKYLLILVGIIPVLNGQLDRI